MNISTLDINELGKGKIRHWAEGKQWSEKQMKILERRKHTAEINKIRPLYNNETYH